MKFSRIVTWTILVAAFVALGYIGNDVAQRYMQYRADIAHDNERADEIISNRNRTMHALEAGGVSTQQISRGFWYIENDSDGSQSVGYFDLDQWSQQEGLSDEQIAALKARIASSTVVDRGSMHVVTSEQLPTNLQFHNQLYNPTSESQFTDTQEKLEKAYKAGTATADQLWQLSYMYELQGNYSLRDQVNAASCKLYKSRCENPITIKISGIVRDMQQRPIQGATVTVLSHPEAKSVQTDAKGSYSMKIAVKSMEKVRISAVKRNYSEGVSSLLVLDAVRTSYAVDTITLGAPISIVTLDTVKHSVTDPKDEALADGSFVLHTDRSTYAIPKDAIMHKDGKLYSGAVDVYLYEFDRNNVPQSLVTLDTFDTVTGFAGNLMLSFGMPYIQFFSPSGEELHVLKSRPMLLTYKIPGMQLLRENADHFASGKLTDEQIDLMISASSGNSGFPITSDFIAAHNLQSFPPFWVMDRKKGVWENVGMRVMDANGTVQVPFYTIDNTN